MTDTPVIAARIAGPAQDNTAGWLESALAVIGLAVVFSTFRVFLLGGNDDGDGGGSALNQIVTIGFSGPAIALLLLYGIPRWFMTVLVRSWPIFALIGLALASIIWTADTGTTLRRSFALVLSTGFVIFLVARFELRDLTRIVLAAASVFVVFGYLAVLVPGVGITGGGGYVGSWRGFTGQKNEFGRVLGILLGVAPILILATRGLVRQLWIAVALMALPLMIMSESRTPFASFLVALPTMVGISILATGRIGAAQISGGIRLILGSTAVFMILTVVLFVVPLFLEFIGRDLTFTGRTAIWDYVLSRAEQRPWLGWGYRAFWVEGNRLPWAEFFAWRAEGNSVAPDHAHSAYVDMIAELGWIGMMCLAGLFISCFRTVVQCHRAGRPTSANLLCFMTIYIALYSLAERSYLQYFDAPWTMLFIFYLNAKRAIVLEEISPKHSRP